MENVNKEIEQFDLLAQSDANETLSDELLSIRNLDALMRQQPLHLSVSEEFTSKVLFDAFKAKRRQSSNRFFVFLFIGFAIPLFLIFLFAAPVSGETMDFPSANQLLDNWLSYFHNPQMKQLFIVLEAIFCLLVIDKIFFSRANTKPSMS